MLCFRPPLLLAWVYARRMLVGAYCLCGLIAAVDTWPHARESGLQAAALGAYSFQALMPLMRTSFAPKKLRRLNVTSSS